MSDETTTQVGGASPPFGTRPSNSPDPATTPAGAILWLTGDPERDRESFRAWCKADQESKRWCQSGVRASIARLLSGLACGLWRAADKLTPALPPREVIPPDRETTRVLVNHLGLGRHTAFGLRSRGLTARCTGATPCEHHPKGETWVVGSAGTEPVQAGSGTRTSEPN